MSLPKAEIPEVVRDQDFRRTEAVGEVIEYDLQPRTEVAINVHEGLIEVRFLGRDGEDKGSLKLDPSLPSYPHNFGVHDSVPDMEIEVLDGNESGNAIYTVTESKV